MGNKSLEWLKPYCENDMRKLKSMSRSIFMKFNEPLNGADYDDFYSISNMTLWQAYNSYNPDIGVSFDGFLRSCLKKKFKTELERRHRQKRILNQLSICLDAENGDGENHSLLEIVPSDFDTFDEATKRMENGRYHDKVQRYLSRLSTMQVNLLNLLADGYKPREITRILEISQKEYKENLQFMRSYENVKILF